MMETITELAHHVQLIGFPGRILKKVQDMEGWELVSETENPELNQDYSLMFEGKRVLRLHRMYGFGWGWQASYQYLRRSIVELLYDLDEHCIRYYRGDVYRPRNHTFDPETEYYSHNN